MHLTCHCGDFIKPKDLIICQEPAGLASLQGRIKDLIMEAQESLVVVWNPILVMNMKDLLCL